MVPNRDVLAILKGYGINAIRRSNGVTPSWVQIGNEITAKGLSHREFLDTYKARGGNWDITAA
jgi:arabinogalactan endo-1,4-beta-galactosidase